MNNTKTTMLLMLKPTKLAIAMTACMAMSACAIEVTNATATTRPTTKTAQVTTPQMPQTVITPTTGSQDTTYDTPTSTYQGGTQTFNIPDYIREVNALTWTPNMKVNTLMTVKMQVLLDRNHVSVGTIDGGWGDASKQALYNFQRMKGLEATGKMNEATWQALNANAAKNQPVIVPYTITQNDARTPLARLPSTTADKAKANGLYFETLDEMLAEKFHMSLAYIRKLNPNSTWKAGDTINVINTGTNLAQPVSHIVVDRATNSLFAYNNTSVIATYPVSVGSTALNVPAGNYKIVNKVNNPWHKATATDKNGNTQTYMLPPGPNSPVGVMWLGFDKASYGIHGAPSPEGVLLPTAMGAIRMINWDIAELASNIKDNVTVEVR